MSTTTIPGSTRSGTTSSTEEDEQQARRQRVLEEAHRLVPILAERVVAHDRDGSFPFENFPDLRDAGLLNLTVPRSAGGDELDIVTVTRVLETIARGDPGTALVLAMQYGQHANLAQGDRRWPEYLYEQVCRESREGIALINSARVEPELGTPARGGLPATVATRTATGWRINGRKIYTTGAPILRWVVVWGRTDDDEPRVGGFLVPMDTPGVRVENTWNQLGMRTAGNSDVVFEDAEIPFDHAVDIRTVAERREQEARISGGLRARGAFLGGSFSAAVYQGVALAARDWVVRYLHERKPTNLGASLATLPRHQTAVGEIESLLFTNETLIYHAAEQADRGIPPKPGLVKHVISTNAIRAVQIGLELVGNPGLSRDNPLERHYRNVLYSRVHTPQSDTVLLAAGKAALGL